MAAIPTLEEMLPIIKRMDSGAFIDRVAPSSLSPRSIKANLRGHRFIVMSGSEISVGLGKTSGSGKTLDEALANAGRKAFLESVAWSQLDKDITEIRLGANDETPDAPEEL